MMLSIDAGKHGGAALFTNDGRLAGTYQFDMPPEPRFPHFDDMKSFMNWIPPTLTTLVAIEALPDYRTVGHVKHKNTQGAVWGVQYASAIIRCNPDEVEVVEARLWKKHFGLGSDKKEALALARSMYPDLPEIQLEKQDGVAEAILIGHYIYDTTN